MSDLTFKALREANVLRNRVYEARAKLDSPVDQWDAKMWTVKLTEEVGELAQALIRFWDEGGDVQAVREEIADVAIVCDLLAACLEINLESAVREKFNARSSKRNIAVML